MKRIPLEDLEYIFQNTKEIKQKTNQRHTQPGDVTTDK